MTSLRRAIAAEPAMGKVLDLINRKVADLVKLRPELRLRLAELLEDIARTLRNRAPEGK